MGSINLDNTGSGGAVTLTSDGTSLLLGGTAVGGAPDLYAANPVSAEAPTARANNSVAIGSSADTYSNDTIAIGTDTIASGASSSAVGHLAKTNSTYAGAFGYNSLATHQGAIALGNSQASGQNSFATVISNNTTSYGATGANSIAIGYQSKSTGNYTVAIGSAEATGSDYSVSMGYRARSASHSTVAIGREAGLAGCGSSSISIGHAASSAGGDSLAIGYSVIANASNSVAIGRHATVGGIIGKYAFANDYISNGGDAQQGTYVLHVSTTNATAIALTSTGTAATTNNQVNLQNNSAYAFHGTIVARQKTSEGTASAAWKVEGLIRREANAGTTVLVNSATTVLDNTPSWGMALTANTSHGGLAITVTGAASTNIRWVATINTSELTYA